MLTLDEDSVDFPAMRRLHDLLGKVNRCHNLMDTLQAIVDGVVEGVGFEVAAINYVHIDKTFEVLAVAGSVAAREKLLGRRLPAAAFDQEFALADNWGALRFVPHDRLQDSQGQDWWVPEPQPLAVPDAWHPRDALFAPLCSPGGDLVGVLSVDLPRDRRRPGMRQRQVLEMFATQAGIAIDNARLTERLQASEETFRLAFELAGNGIAMLSLSPSDFGRYIRVNSAMCHIVGRTEKELLAAHFQDITHPDDRERDMASARNIAAGGPMVDNVEKRYIRGDGSIVWAAVTAAIVSGADGGAHYAIVQIEDISDRRAAREDLTHRVGHDDLTGLPNRHSLRKRLASAIDSHHSGRQGALLFCDLDGFKRVNDTHGHSAGDRVLIVVAQRLSGASRRADTVARLGGDEFVILAENTTPEKARQLAERLRRAVASPVVVGKSLVHLTVSIGMAHIGEHDDPAEVMIRADADMYRVKALRTAPARPRGQRSGLSKSRV